MRSIKAIAINTFREGIRNRIMYNLVFFALCMIAFSYFIGELSIGEELKVIQDMGLAAISIFGILIAIFVGIGLVYKEVDKRTIYTIISKPIHRYQFLLGKFFGLSLMLLVQTVFMTAFMFIFIYITNHIFNPALLKVVLFIYLELVVITSVAIFFSSFTTPFLSALFCLGFFIIGHSTDDLVELSKRSDSAVVKVGASLFKFFDLNHFNIKGKIVHGVYVGWDWVGQVVLYAAFLSVVFLITSFFIFQKRDFK